MQVPKEASSYMPLAFLPIPQIAFSSIIPKTQHGRLSSVSLLSGYWQFTRECWLCKGLWERNGDSMKTENQRTQRRELCRHRGGWQWDVQPRVQGIQCLVFTQRGACLIVTLAFRRTTAFIRVNYSLYASMLRRTAIHVNILAYIF